MHGDELFVKSRTFWSLVKKYPGLLNICCPRKNVHCSVNDQSRQLLLLFTLAAKF